MKKSIIHIGYPKTGSTWLQEDIFLKNDEFLRVPKRIVDSCILEPDYFSFELAQTKDLFYQYFCKAGSVGKTLLVSSELLCGNANLNGGVNSNIYAERLKSIMPNSKVLIVIREQLSWLECFYRMEVSLNNVTYKPNELMTLKNGVDRISKFLISFLFYDKLIKMYQDLFGKENVLVLPYELLVENSQTFLESIASFATINQLSDFTNSSRRLEGSTIEVVRIKRILNIINSSNSIFKISDNFIHQLSRINSNKNWFYDGVKDNEKIFNLFKVSNTKTSKLINVNLFDFGYM